MQSVQRRTLIPQYHPEKDVKIANVRENGKQRKFKKAEVLKMRKKFLADEVESKVGGRVPFDLQFFAEDPADQPIDDPDPADPPVDEPDPAGPPEPTAEERIQQLMIEAEKWKLASDKASKEAADYKKRYNSKLTETEKASQEKAETEAKRLEEFDAMKRKIAITDLANNFMEVGYPKALADKAAVAQYDGDNEAAIKFQKEFLDAKVKQEKAEWLKSRPQVKSGSDEGGGTDVTKEQFNRMGYLQRLEFKKKFPETYKSYTG